MKRSGFTLIELLVVMLIIGLLMAITVTVYAQAAASARHSATRTAILIIDRAIKYRAENFERRNFRSAAATLKNQYDTAGNPSPNDTLPLELALLLEKKNQFRGAFPQRLEDLFGIDGIPGTIDDSALWVKWKATCNANGVPVTDSNIRPTEHRIDLENSELLYLFLSQGALFGDASFSVDRINPAQIRDSNRNGHPEIIDGWENPIRFYNWPTRLVRPGGGENPIDQKVFAVTARKFMAITPPPSTPSPYPLVDRTTATPEWYWDHPLNNDPDDPLGSMSAAIQATGILQATYNLNRAGSPGIGRAFNEANYHTLDTFHAPLVISAGPDGKLGLAEPTEMTAPERRNADLESLDDALDNVSILP